MPSLSLLQLVVVTFVVGFLLWLLQTRVTFIDATIKQILYWGAIVILVLLWILFILNMVGLGI